jgi:hypothetical protein
MRLLLASAPCTGNNIIRTEGILGVWEGNGEHGSATVLEGTDHVAEGRDDGTIERNQKVLLQYLYHTHNY